MIKIIHTSDWHLGHELYGHDRMSDHLSALGSLCEIVSRERPDALIVSGDIYHTATPSNAVMTLFDRIMTRIHRTCPDMRIIVIAGNHDSPSRLEISSSVWSELGADMIGGIRRDKEGKVDFDSHIISLTDSEENVTALIVALPHIYAGSYPSDDSRTLNRDERQYAFLKSLGDAVERRRGGRDIPVIMSAHLAITGCDMSGHDEQGGIEYLPMENIPVDFDYLALGHIHCRQTMRRGNALAHYCGTPVGISFDERSPHSVTVAELSGHGTRPELRQAVLCEPRPLVTWPSDGKCVSFDEAIAALSDWKDDCYLRISVYIEDVAPPHAIERAHRAAAAGQGHFCVFNWVRKVAPGSSESDPLLLDVEQFKAITPLDMALDYYRDKVGAEMPETLRQMLEEITNPLL